MSILLIGQKSSPPPQYYQIPTPKQYEISREYNMRQIRHRTQLQQQIEENRQRKIKQKQLERALDKQRQIAVLKEVYRRYEKQQKEPKQWFGRRSFCNRQFHDYRNNFLESTNNSIDFMNMKHCSSNRMVEQRKSLRKPLEISIRPIQHRPRTIKTQNSIYEPQYTQSQIFYNPVNRNTQAIENQKFMQFQEPQEEIDDEYQEEIYKPIIRQKSSRLKRLNQKLKRNKHTFDNRILEQNSFSELPSWSTSKPVRHFYKQENPQQTFQIKQGQKFQQYPQRSQISNSYNNPLKSLHKRVLSKFGQ